MKDLLKLALLAGGGYWLFYQLTERQAASGSPAAPATPEPAGPNGATPAPPPSNPTPPSYTPPVQTPTPTAPAAPTLTLEQRIRAASGKRNAADTLTYDQWNYYFQQLTGGYGPAIEDAFPGLERSAQMTYAQFANALSNFGLGRLRQNRLW